MASVNPKAGTAESGKSHVGRGTEPWPPSTGGEKEEFLGDQWWRSNHIHWRQHTDAMVVILEEINFEVVGGEIAATIAASKVPNFKGTQMLKSISRMKPNFLQRTMP